MEGKVEFSFDMPGFALKYKFIRNPPTFIFSHISGNVSFSDLVYEMLRSLLLTISQKEGLEPLKVDAFILVRLPFLLEKMYKLHKASDVNAPLKTPTDVYKAFDKLLANEALLDSTDLRFKQNRLQSLKKWRPNTNN